MGLLCPSVPYFLVSHTCAYRRVYWKGQNESVQFAVIRTNCTQMSVLMALIANTAWTAINQMSGLITLRAAMMATQALQRLICTGFHANNFTFVSIFGLRSDDVLFLWFVYGRFLLGDTERCVSADGCERMKKCEPFV